MYPSAGCFTSTFDLSLSWRKWTRYWFDPKPPTKKRVYKAVNRVPPYKIDKYLHGAMVRSNFGNLPCDEIENLIKDRCKDALDLIPDNS